MNRTGWSGPTYPGRRSRPPSPARAASASGRDRECVPWGRLPHPRRKTLPFTLSFHTVCKMLASKPHGSGRSTVENGGGLPEQNFFGVFGHRRVELWVDLPGLLVG